MTKGAVNRTLKLLGHALKQTEIRYWSLVLPACLAALASIFEGLSITLLFPALQLVLNIASDDHIEGLALPNLIVNNIPASKGWLLAAVISLTLISTLFKVFLSYVSSILTAYQVKQFAHRLRHMLYERYLSFGKLFFDHNSLGHQQQILTTYVSVISLTLTSFQMALYASCTSLIYLLIMMMISWPLTLLVLMVFPVLHYLLNQLIERIVASSEAYTQAYNELGKKIVSALSAIPLIKSYCFESSEQGNFSYLSGQVAAYEYSIEKKNLLLGPLQEFILVCFLVLLAGLIALIESTGSSNSVAEYLLFILVLKRASTLFGVFNTLRSSVASISGPFDELMHIFNDNNKHYVQEGSEEFKGLSKGIEFRNLNYTFPNGSKAIQGLNLEFPKGKITGVVGESGAGKSTLINLLMRFYDPPENSIFVDSQDVRNYTLKSWRSKIALVSQESFILHGSLISNLLYGLEREVTAEELSNVLEMAQLSKLVAGLPEGLQSQVGERGLQLSGGERQRLSIARAMLKGAEILLFDEAVSALDSLTEREVQKALDRLIAGKTAIIIAHRISSVWHAENIIVLENGKVLEQGSPKELLRANGKFAQYYDQQGVKQPT